MQEIEKQTKINQQKMPKQLCISILVDLLQKMGSTTNNLKKTIIKNGGPIFQRSKRRSEFRIQSL